MDWLVKIDKVSNLDIQANSTKGDYSPIQSKMSFEHLTIRDKSCFAASTWTLWIQGIDPDSWSNIDYWWPFHETRI